MTADRDAAVDRLAAELAEVSRRVELVRHELAGLRDAAPDPDAASESSSAPEPSSPTSSAGEPPGPTTPADPPPTTPAGPPSSAAASGPGQGPPPGPPPWAAPAGLGGPPPPPGPSGPSGPPPPGAFGPPPPGASGPPPPGASGAFGPPPPGAFGPSSGAFGPPPPGAFGPPPPGAFGPPPGAFGPPPPGAIGPPLFGPRRPEARAPAPGPAGDRAPLRAVLGARLLAITGGVVTLLGVLLLLVLAARNGWFGPPTRVVAGAVVGLALVGTGVRVRRRTHTVGAVVLVATGVAALYLDVAAASALYRYVPPPVALLLAAVVLAGGLLLADRWRHQGLAIGVLVGGGALAPIVAKGVTPLVVALLVVAQLVVLPVSWRQRWAAVALVATGLATLEALVAVLVADIEDVAAVTGPWSGRVPAMITALAVLIVGAATAIVTRDRLSPAARAGTLVLAVPAVLVAASLFSRAPAAGLVGGVAVAALVVAWILRRADPVLAYVAVSVGAVAGFEATAIALRGPAQSAVLLGQALVLALIARRLTARGPLVAAAGYGAIGLVIVLARDLRPPDVSTFPSRLAPVAGVREVPALVGGVVVAVVLVAAAMALLLALSRLGALADRTIALMATASLGLMALYGAAGAVVGLALLISPTRAGFLTGHALVTVSWTIVALFLLVRGLRDTTPRVLGGVLVVAAVVKLVFFDLVALDGIARVAAFLGAGIVLLVAGTRYARLVAENPEPEQHPSESDPPGTTEGGAPTPEPDAAPAPDPPRAP